MNQNITPMACFWIQSPAQKLDELLLPLAGLDPASRAVISAVMGELK